MVVETVVVVVVVVVVIVVFGSGEREFDNAVNKKSR